MKKIITLSTLLLCSLSLIACSKSEKRNEVKTEASSSVQEASSQESDRSHQYLDSLLCYLQTIASLEHDPTDPSCGSH